MPPEPKGHMRAPAAVKIRHLRSPTGETSLACHPRRSPSTSPFSYRGPQCPAPRLAPG